MDTYARVIPNHLGQPYKLAFSSEALTACGLSIGDGVRAELEAGDVVRLTADPDSKQRIRSYNVGSNAPYVSLSRLLSGPNQREALGRGAVNAQAELGQLTVWLRRPLSEEEYRWRRWRGYQRHDPTMSDEGVTDLTARKGQNMVTPVPIPLELRQALEIEATALKMTVSMYIVHVLGSVERTALLPPVAEGWRSGGWQVRNALAQGQALTAAEMIERSIPPASDREWLTAQVEAGVSYAELARKYGGSNSVYSRWGRQFGLTPDRLALSRKARHGS